MPGTNSGTTRGGQRVGGEHVHEPAGDVGGRGAVERPQQLLDLWRDLLGRRRGARGGATARRAGAGARSRPRRAQRAGERVQDQRRRVPVAALLEADVVLGADPGEHRQLRAAQPGHAATVRSGMPTSSGRTSSRRARRYSPTTLASAIRPQLRARAARSVALSGPLLTGVWLDRDRRHTLGGMRVFVTGATGFIGSAIVQELLGAGHQVARPRPLGRGRRVARRRGGRGASRRARRPRQPAARARPRPTASSTPPSSTTSRTWRRTRRADLRAIEALGEALEGSDRPLVVTSGTALLAAGPARDRARRCPTPATAGAHRVAVRAGDDRPRGPRRPLVRGPAPAVGPRRGRPRLRPAP